MKKIHKKIIQLQASKISKCVNGTYHLCLSRAEYKRRHGREYTKGFDAVIKHNNAWFNSVPEQILTQSSHRCANLMRSLLRDSKGIHPNWCVQHWTGTYEWRKMMAIHCGRTVTQHILQK